MAIKAILLDFDGTSLQKDQIYISERNMKALNAVMERGIQVIPSTGRCEDMFPPQIEADPRVRYWVTSNGGRVVDRQTGEVIYSSLFTPEEAAMFCRMYEGRQIYSEIAAEGKIVMEKEVCANIERYHVPPHHMWFIDEKRQVEVEKPSEYFLKNHIGVEKFNIYGVPKELQASLIAEIEATGVANISDGAGVNIQFFPKRQSRVEAVRKLFERLGYGYESVMSLGDTRLDADMIEYSAIGVAMGNAAQCAKDVADFITLPYDQDGVAVALEKFLLD